VAEIVCTRKIGNVVARVTIVTDNTDITAP
jgi:hypothetical protein